MADRHPDPVSLNRFGRGELPATESSAVVRHLLTGCAVCRRVTRRFLPPALAGRPRLGEDGAVLSFDYSSAFERARRAVVLQQTALASEQCGASELLSELSSHPHDRQRLLVANSARFQTWSLCELLLDASREQAFREPARALELARLGVDVAERLDGRTYGEARVHDLSARAWATLANAERIRSDFRAADDGFAHARLLLRQGTGDPLEKARLLLLEASLRSDQRRFTEAFRLLDRVIRLAGRYDDLHLCGKALITKGLFFGYAGQHEAAIQALQEGNAKIDPAVEPRLVLAGRHNLILYLAESGRHEEALALLDGTRPLYAQLGDRIAFVRLQWLEGRIAQALGQEAKAEALLHQVREEFVRREIGFDAALASLDLAGIYARQRRAGEMRRLANEMLPIFRSRDVHREALAALVVFQKAAEMERVTVGLVRELSDYLEQCRIDPGLKFSQRP